MTQTNSKTESNNEVELTQEQLHDIAGGATAIEYGLIARSLPTLDTRSGNDRLRNKIDTGSGNDRLR